MLPRTFWVEDGDSGPDLWTQEGTAVSCVRVLPTAPGSIVATPGGTLANHFGFLNTGGAPRGVEGDLSMTLSVAATQGMNWDDQQVLPPPTPPIDSVTGDADLVLRGGGCVQSSQAFLVKFDNVTVFQYPGIRSPDIDGNCVVDPGDRAYVESRLGTQDFCADLDGSGTVDATDLALVDQTLGEQRSQVADVPAPCRPAGIGSGYSAARPRR
jgi:hypothetical protein